MKALFRIVVILLMAHAIYRFLPPYYHDERFGTELRNVAQFWRQVNEDEVAIRTLELAEKHKVPITRDNLTIQIGKERILIDIAYQVQVEWVPGFKKPWKFSQHHDIWAIQIRKMPDQRGR